MKLQDVMLMGMLCGLRTVGECVTNYEMHYLSFIPYSEVTDDVTELNKDLKAYYEGELVLDWEWLFLKNEENTNQMEADLDRLNAEPIILEGF